MKFKVNTTSLLYILMVQIIIIDLFVGVLLVKAINKIKYNTSIRKADEIHLDMSKNIKVNQFAQNTYNNGKQVPLGIEKLKVEVLKGMVEKLYLNKPIKSRDFKISDNSTLKDGEFIATAYDLSYESCGKYSSNPAYGITFSGKKAEKGRTIAVDPNKIPLGSKVLIEFPKQYSFLDGWYMAEDTGSSVKGNIIDIFLGESAFLEMEKFGSKKVSVKVIYPNIMSSQIK